MPPPVCRKTALAPIVERVAGLETRLRVQVAPGPDVQLMIDPDQFEQMLINLARNAVEAALEPRHSENGSQEATNAPSSCGDPQVVLHWDLTEKELVLTVDDNGPGFLNPSNAFVPFYTTKPAGSGIGLVLCRQIAEAHGGSIELLNQREKRGCRARVMVPRSPAGL
jgi:signal transduction histidine kinase